MISPPLLFITREDTVLLQSRKGVELDLTLEQINDLFTKVQTMSDSEKLSQILVGLVILINESKNPN